MSIRPKAFDAIHDPSANPLLNFCQNAFYLKGITTSHHYVRVLKPKGLAVNNPRTIYVRLGNEKPITTRDFFNTMGKVILLSTGFFTLILLTAHLIHFGLKKRKYVVVEEAQTANIQLEVMKGYQKIQDSRKKIPSYKEVVQTLPPLPSPHSLTPTETENALPPPSAAIENPTNPSSHASMLEPPQPLPQSSRSTPPLPENTSKVDITSVDMKTITKEELKKIFYDQKKNLRSDVLEMVRQLSLDQLQEGLKGEETKKVFKELLPFLAPSQVQHLSPKFLGGLALMELRTFDHDFNKINTPMTLASVLSDEQLSAVLGLMSAESFQTISRTRLSNLNFSNLDRTLFKSLFSVKSGEWYQGLEAPFIVKLYSQNLLDPAWFVQLPDDLFQQLDFNHLSSSDKRGLVKPIHFTLNGQPQELREEAILKKCSKPQESILIAYKVAITRPKREKIDRKAKGVKK